MIRTADLGGWWRVEYFDVSVDPVWLVVFIGAVVGLSYLLDGVKRARGAWHWSRDLRYRWRAKRRGVHMEPWQRRTGRHDHWS